MVLGVEKLEGFAVRHHVALEAPFVAQYVGEKPAAASDGLAVVVVVRTHHAQRAGLSYGLAEGFEVEGAHFALAHMGIGAGVAVAASHRDGVHGKVLGGSHQPVGLQSDDHLLAQFAHEIRVFAIRLHAAAPAGVLGYVEYRRVDVGVAQRHGFLGFCVGYLPYQLSVPCASLTCLVGEVGGAIVAETAYALVGEVDGDAQSGLFDKPALHGVEGVDMSLEGEGVLGSEAAHAVVLLVDVADAVFPHLVLPSLGGQGVGEHAARAIERSQLAGLFLYGHLLQQVGHAGINRCAAVFIDIHAPVLVEVYPTFVVDALGFCVLSRQKRQHQRQRYKDSAPALVHSLFCHI